MAKEMRIEKIWVGDQLVTRKVPVGDSTKKTTVSKPVEEKDENEDSYFTKSELRANQKADLQQMCVDRGISDAGTKDDIIDRLMSYQEENNKG